MADVMQWLEILRTSGIDRRDVTPHPDSSSVGIVTGACPGCGVTPFLLHASSPHIATGKPDTLQGNGYAKCCGDPVGYVYAKKSTLFGLEEDRAILEFGRARIYGR